MTISPMVDGNPTAVPTDYVLDGNANDSIVVDGGSGGQQIIWGTDPAPFYESGIDRGVLYPDGAPGVPWNGLKSVEDASIGGEVTSYYIDGIKYIDTVARRNYQGTLKAFSAPEELDICLGNARVRPGFILTRQPRSRFDLSYRTMISGDVGYKLHFIYNVIATPTNLGYTTKKNSVDPTEFAFRLDAAPPSGSGYFPSAHLSIDSRLINAELLAYLEDILYGTSSQDPQMPSQSDILAIMNDVITDPIAEPI